MLVARTELRHWIKGKTTSISVLVYTMLTSAALAIRFRRCQLQAILNLEFRCLLDTLTDFCTSGG